MTRFPRRCLGPEGPEVPALGLGCMGMSQAYGARDDDESVATVRAALDTGIVHIDTADVYGAGHNEELVGRAIAGRRDEVFLATKFSLTRVPGSPAPQIDGRPENVRRSCEASLRRLGVEHVDLYYQHRVDPTVPIEDTVGAMAELVRAGKVRHLGLSEASARSIERAAAVHRITALQSEWSLWTRELEDEVIHTVRRLGIGLVAYSPLGRGFLSGAITSPDDFPEGDSRRTNPRFTGDNFWHNLALVDAVREIAAGKGCTPGQLALAWVLSRGDDVVAIPGTKRRRYLAENAEAASIQLEPADLELLEAAVPTGSAAGQRTAAVRAYGDSPEPTVSSTDTSERAGGLGGAGRAPGVRL